MFRLIDDIPRMARCLLRCWKVSSIKVKSLSDLSEDQLTIKCCIISCLCSKYRIVWAFIISSSHFSFRDLNSENFSLICSFQTFVVSSFFSSFFSVIHISRYLNMYIKADQWKGLWIQNSEGQVDTHHEKIMGTQKIFSWIFWRRRKTDSILFNQLVNW